MRLRARCQYCKKIIVAKDTPFARIDSYLKWHEKACYLNPKNKKYCKYCEKLLVYKKRTRRRFCNNSCSQKYNVDKKKKKYKCKMCGKIEFRVLQKKSGTCSLDCYKVLIYNQNLKKLKEGKSVKRKFIKQYLIDVYSRKCFKCGRKTWNGEPIYLELHHVDESAKKRFLLSNLELLCPNCHAQTDNFRHKSNGRD